LLKVVVCNRGFTWETVLLTKIPLSNHPVKGKKKLTIYRFV
jgi:hypothetical protein